MSGSTPNSSMTSSPPTPPAISAMVAPPGPATPVWRCPCRATAPLRRRGPSPHRSAQGSHPSRPQPLVGVVRCRRLRAWIHHDPCSGVSHHRRSCLPPLAEGASRGYPCAHGFQTARDHCCGRSGRDPGGGGRSDRRVPTGRGQFPRGRPSHRQFDSSVPSTNTTAVAMVAGPGEQIATLALPGGSYTPAPPNGGTDDYRCFVLDLPAGASGAATGFSRSCLAGTRTSPITPSCTGSTQTRSPVPRRWMPRIRARPRVLRRFAGSSGSG